jgi:hypothetical protein
LLDDERVAFWPRVTIPATILPFVRRKTDRRQLGPDPGPDATPPTLDLTLRQGEHLRRYRIASYRDGDWYAWIWLDDAPVRGVRTTGLSTAFRLYAEFSCEIAELTADGWRVAGRRCDTDLVGI